MTSKKNRILAAVCIGLALFCAACKVETDEEFGGDIAGAQTSGGHSAPKNLDASTPYSGSGKIDLSWNAVDGAAKYNVYYAKIAKGPYTYLDDSLTSSGTVSGLGKGTTYYFKVTAVFDDGEESPFSASTSATTR